MDEGKFYSQLYIDYINGMSTKHEKLLLCFHWNAGIDTITGMLYQ